MTTTRMIMAALALAFVAQATGGCAEARTTGGTAAAAEAARVATTPAADHDDDDGFTERDESRQRYGLSPGARVSLESVSGHVTIKTGGGSEAEVYIIRRARRREDLRCREFNVEATPAGLRLNGNDDRRECRNVQVRQNVEMRLPRAVNLEVTSVSGHVNVGEIDGSVKLTSISGHANVKQAAGEAIITSVSGHVTINMSSVGGRGIRINSVSGNIEVGLPEGANADWRVSSISGRVVVDAPNVTMQKNGPADYEGRVGSGGTPMTFNSISGTVRFRRASE